MNIQSNGVLLPQWPAPARVHAACSTRAGGVSTGPWHALNLGDHVGDDAQAVRENRARWSRSLGAAAVYLRQVHGTRVASLRAGMPDGAEADACVSVAPRLACTILVADCLPILLCEAGGTAVAAAHAGWRGLAGGVAEAAVAALRAAAAAARRTHATRPGDLLAWLGPCIGQDAFEVGAEVRAAFVAGDAGADAHFRPGAPGKWHADLAALARRRLAQAGVAAIHGNDSTAPWCTVSNPSIFFSFRRDGISGRLAASIWLD